MAKNRIYAQREMYSKHLKVTTPTYRADGLAKSGDPVMRGDIPGVAVNDADSAGAVVIQEDGVYELSVKGIDGGGNSAVVGGDKLYFTAGDNPAISKKATGKFFGSAYGDVGVSMVTAGATTTIQVQVGR